MRTHILANAWYHLFVPKQYNCITCKTIFHSTKGCKTRKPQYCSRKCFSSSPRTLATRQKMSEAKRGKVPPNKLPRGTKPCVYCKKPMEILIGAYHKPKYCSMNCRNEAAKQYDYSHFKGEKSHFWKGGVTTENERIRKSARYRNWRTSVFRRDNYTCQHCGQTGGELQADHIKPFAYYKELRFDINNGQTLCKQCHHATDTFGSKAMKHEIQ